MRGAVALAVGLALLALLAVAGLALDLGQLFVAKTEQQNAMDACALAASRELKPAPMTLAQFQRAETAGKAIGAMNRRLFQGEAIAAGDIDVTFSPTLGGTYVSAASAVPNGVNFVRCTTRRAGIVTWFMHLWGHDSEAVAATAVASLQPTGSPPVCIIPLAMCTRTTPDVCGAGNPGPDANGLCPGKWYSGRFSTGNSFTGNFNWVDFDGSGGGANVIAQMLQGSGCINISPGITQVPAETGSMSSAADAWNSRFGIYKNGGGSNPQPGTSPPDLTGYSYNNGPGGNWPSGRDAYDDYILKQAGLVSYGPTVNNPAWPGNQYRLPSYSSTPTGSGPGAHGDIGAANRRVVVMPGVNCSTWNSNHVATVSGLVCALMITPYFGPTIDVNLEYLGTVEAAGSKCPSYGAPGGGTGPKVPTLVQ